jgi:hypothetical protein
MGNQNPYIAEKQTKQRPKENRQTDKQRSIKHTHTIKDRVTRTPLKANLALIDVFVILSLFAIVFSVIRFTFLITPFVSSNFSLSFFSFGNYIVCTLNDGF